jgi:hypothetical protein
MRAALILVGLGALVAMELEASPRTRKAVNDPLARSTIGLSASRDILTKADRREYPYVQYEPAARPITCVERMPPPDPTAIIPQEAPKIIDRRRRGASFSSCLDRGLSTHFPGKLQIASVQKVTVEVKSCRANTFDSLRKALNLSPACET